MSDTHPLITIFGVIIGVNLFGFLGVIFGPLMLSIFILLIKVYIDEFGRAGVERH
jgi:predicted PurR-regulated permease PerM